MSTLEQAGTGLHNLTKRQLAGTLTGLLLTLFLAALDQTIVGTAMPRIIAELKRQGYKFVTIPEMLAHLPNPVIVESNFNPPGSRIAVLSPGLLKGEHPSDSTFKGSGVTQYSQQIPRGGTER